ncbi:hypothetical protein ASE07_04805 [Noviherbaspirillum sp. Root189]|nr:hypothetical protein ASE07_04805 [Noviherbaspirillum sp. Root189]
MLLADCNGNTGRQKQQASLHESNHVGGLLSSKSEDVRHGNTFTRFLWQPLPSCPKGTNVNMRKNSYWNCANLLTLLWTAISTEYSAYDFDSYCPSTYAFSY